MVDRPRVERFSWDDWNLEHIAKHAVMPEEAEEVVIGDATVQKSYKQRFQFVGPTVEGRMLSVIVGAVPDYIGVYYVFSARPASRKERREYKAEKGVPTHEPSETNG